MDNNSQCKQVYFSKKEDKDILVLKVKSHSLKTLILVIMTW